MKIILPVTLDFIVSDYLTVFGKTRLGGVELGVIMFAHSQMHAKKNGDTWEISNDPIEGARPQKGDVALAEVDTDEQFPLIGFRWANQTVAIHLAETAQEVQQSEMETKLSFPSAPKKVPLTEENLKVTDAIYPLDSTEIFKLSPARNGIPYGQIDYGPLTTLVSKKKQGRYENHSNREVVICVKVGKEWVKCLHNPLDQVEVTVVPIGQQSPESGESSAVG